MSAARKLLFGAGGADDSALFTYGSGGLDAAASYHGTAKSNRVAIAGIGGEVAFYTLHLAVVVDQVTEFDITPMIDDAPLAMQPFVVTPEDDGVRFRSVIEVPLVVQLPNTIAGYDKKGEWAPRGMWFQVQIATLFEGPAGYVQIDGVEIEHEVVREGRGEGQTP